MSTPILTVAQIVAAPTRNSVGVGVNGPERRSANLVRRWSETAIRPLTFYPRRGRCWEIFSQSGHPVVDFEIDGKWDLGAGRRLRPAILEHQARVIHTQGPPSLDLIACLAARKLRIASIITRPFMIDENNTYSAGKRLVYGMVDRISLQLVGKVVAVSQAGLSFLRQRLRVPNEKSCLIYNGINLKSLVPASMSGHVGRPTLGMVAQLTKPKGWHTFLEVVSIVRKSFGNLRAVIVGDGPLRGELEIEVRQRNLQDTVEFAGFRSPIAPILNEMCVFTLTSFREGLSVAVLEAMACGLPVVATDVGGTREQVIDDVNGFICQPGDAATLAGRIQLILQDTELRRRLGMESRRRAELLFSEDAMLSNYSALYRELGTQ